MKYYAVLGGRSIASRLHEIMSSRLSHGRTRVPSETIDKRSHEYEVVAAAPSTPPTSPARISRPVSGSARCPQCGAHIHPAAITADAQRRIAELESEVRILTRKATDAGMWLLKPFIADIVLIHDTATADKLADYEEELLQLKSATHIHQSPPTSIKDKENEPLPPVPSPGEAGTVHSLSKRPSTTSRFSSFLSSKKSNASLQSIPAPSVHSSAARESDLNTALIQERSLREEAEKKVTQMNVEIEDLSSTLFQQANEMVSTERKARAKLEEKAELFEKRCAMLEDRVEMLEKRDAEKKRRLDMLEEASKRTERVRKLLAQAGG